MCIFTIKRLILLCACISILSGNCALSGGSQEVLDHAWRVGSERPPRTAVESLTLLRTLLYPPSSPLAFVPAVFHFPYSSTSRANATLAMRNCTIWTLCPTLSAYAMAFPGIGTFTMEGDSVSMACLDVAGVANVPDMMNAIMHTKAHHARVSSCTR